MSSRCCVAPAILRFARLSSRRNIRRFTALRSRKISDTLEDFVVAKNILHFTGRYSRRNIWYSTGLCSRKIILHCTGLCSRKIILHFTGHCTRKIFYTLLDFVVAKYLTLYRLDFVVAKISDTLQDIVVENTLHFTHPPPFHSSSVQING